MAKSVNPYKPQGTKGGGVAMKQSGGSTMQPAGITSGGPYKPQNRGNTGGVQMKQSRGGTQQPAGQMTGSGSRVPVGVKRPK